MSGVRSVGQAFAILRVVADAPALTLTEIAKITEISPSSCLALLKTLVSEGAIEQQPGKRYAIAVGWSGPPGIGGDRAGRLIAVARPHLTTLARRWEVTAGLWRAVSRDRMQLVALGENAAATRIHMAEGQRQPIGSGAVGRACSAAQEVDPAELARRFAAVRWRRHVDVADYVAEVAEAKRRGYSVDDRDSHAGIASVAVVVPQTAPLFCLSATMFADARTPAEIDAIANDLQSLARTLVNDQEPHR